MSDKKKDINKKFEQKISLEKVINQSFRYHEKQKDDRNRTTIENMMEWNKENLSPNGGKKPFVRTEPNQPKPRKHTRWLTKNED